MREKRCFALGAILALTAAAHAQPITVEVGGVVVQQVANGGNVDVNIGTVTGDVLIQIYDADANGATPANSVGSVTIRGAVGTTGTPVLRVLVAGEDISAFGFSPTDPIADSGVRDFGGGPTGGLFIIDSDPNGPDLRDVTRLAMAVSGDITGTIDVGQVFRIQALGRGSAATYAGGNISADITAHTWDDNFDVTEGFKAMAFIGAGNAITGDIVATGALDGSEILPGSIHQIRVGVEANNDGGSPARPAAAGITGDIRAELGHVGTIYSEGPIGVSATERSTIWAGDGIDEIRIVRFDQNGSPAEALDKNMSADVQSNRLAITHPTQFVYDDSRRDGTLHLLQTDGDFTGNIAAGNVAGGSDLSPDRYGIFVRGSIALPAGSPLTNVIDIGLNLH